MSVQRLVSKTTQSIKIDPNSLQATIHIGVNYLKIDQAS